MPGTDDELWDLILGLAEGDVVAAVEKVTGYVGRRRPKRGEQETDSGGDPGSAMFTFGTSYGMARMALCAAGVRRVLVPAATWQAAIGVQKRAGRKKQEWKNSLKDMAQSLFPEIKVTLATADALLIAHYCRRYC